MMVYMFLTIHKVFKPDGFMMIPDLNGHGGVTMLPLKLKIINLGYMTIMPSN